jgi:hypothetical protein
MKAYILLLSVFYSYHGLAGEGQGSVAILFPTTNTDAGVVFVGLGGVNAHTDKPACSGTQWALSLATPAGRGVYATLLSAQAQSKPVILYGFNNCNIWGDRESIAGAVLQ